MNQVDTPPVLRCERCSKPFDKESSLKRHGYYCRSRKLENVSRVRACISCARRKARCDNKQPACSRCLGKGIKCLYQPNTRGSAGQNNQGTNDALMQQREAVPTSVDHPEAEYSLDVGNDDNMLINTAFNTSEADFAELGPEYLQSDLDLADILDPKTADTNFQLHSLEPSSLVGQSIPWSGQENQVQQPIYSQSMSIPTMPNYALRSFSRRPKLKTSEQRIGNLICYTLKSYPRMILRDNALPPFIHPYLVYSGAETTEMEPLTNCLSLVHMISSGIHGSRKLFWKNARMECERLVAEHLQLKKWQLLAAMQALSVYILVRLDEGETEHNNLDSLLTTAVILTATRFGNIEVDTQSDLQDPSLERTWRDWILEESARRLCVVNQIVNMLVYFDPAAMCDLHQTEMLIAPLPAKKQLWEAGDELAWKMQSEREPGGLETAFGLAANGDLLRVDKVRPYCRDAHALHPKPSEKGIFASHPADWEEWCSGMDGFGGLIMLAASLVA